MLGAASSSHGLKVRSNFAIKFDMNALLMAVTNFVCFCYLIALYIQQTMENIPNIQAVTNGLIILGALLSLGLNLLRKRKTEWLFYIAFAAFSWLIVYMLRPEWHYRINEFFSTICYMLIGLNFVKSKHNTLVYNWLLYITLGILFLRIAVLGESFREILHTSSYNFISVLALFYLVIAVKVQTKNNVKISLKEIVLFFLVTLFSYGRGGIISGLIFAVLALLLLVLRIKNLPLKLFIIVAGMVLLVFTVQELWDMIWASGLLDKFVRLSLDLNGRTYIWGKYLSSCFESIASFLYGGDPSFLIDGNIHNSFLQMYATFGLPFFVANVIIITKILISDLRCKDYQSLIVTVTFLVRCFTDRVLFRGYSEIAYFFILFDYLCSRKAPLKSKAARNQQSGAVHVPAVH